MVVKKDKRSAETRGARRAFLADARGGGFRAIDSAGIRLTQNGAVHSGPGRESLIVVTLLSLLVALVPDTVSAAADKSGVKPSVLSLPSGPGSIEGLGESFQPQLNTGTATYAVKLKVPPGRSGFSPELTLTYNSGSGNGMYGMGWGISIPSLQRRTDKRLPFYKDAPDGTDADHDGVVDNFAELDTITWSNGEELVQGPDGYSRMKTESEFTRFARSGSGWIATRRDGSVMHLGTSPASQVVDGDGHVFRWYVDDVIDTNGNTIAFVYQKLDASNQVYLHRIHYNPSDGSGMRIELQYETRPDVITDFRPGYELRTAFRCRQIDMSLAGAAIRSYRLAYEATSVTQPLSLLSSVTQVGRDGTTTVPPATFTYTQFSPAAAAAHSMPGAPGVGFNSGDIDLLDLNFDGLPDILDTSAAAHAYYLNKGLDGSGTVQWDIRRDMAVSLFKQLSSDDVQLVDVDGDGRTDLLDKFGTDTNAYHLDSNLNWALTAVLSSAGFDLSNPDVRLVDVNGDKRTDVLLTGSSDITVWLSLGTNRWSTPYSWPSPGFGLQFSNGDIQLADLNGDGLQDLVRLNDGICIYYPTAGYGRYAAAMTYDGAPTGVFDPSHLILDDVNGDGRADVLYESGSSVQVYVNLGLNPSDPTRGSFAAPYTVIGPYTDSGSVFRQADVNGNGSADIVWNTYPGGGSDTLAFVEFAPGEQPYQLKTMDNGIGRTTTLYYSSSVDEMLRDDAASRLWPQGVPFPVQVVSKIEVRDGRDPNVYTTQIQYHDGYYDGAEKEFRGFAAAEQIEVGDDTQGAPTLVTSYAFDTGAAIDALKGKPLSVATKTASGDVFAIETNTWQTRTLVTGSLGDSRAVTFAFQSKRVKDVLERGNGTPVRILSEYDFDDYGNMILDAEYGRVEDLDSSGAIGDSNQDKGAWQDERITSRIYSSAYPSGLSNWILDSLIQEEISGLDAVVAARKRNFYDDELYSTSSLGSVTKGNLTMSLDWADPASATDFVKSVRKRYDPYGNVIRIDDPLSGTAPGHFRELVYDPTFHTYPIQEIIHTGNIDATGGDPTLTMQATYDAGFGAMATSTEFNGFTTKYGYDTFGRLTSIVKPGDSDAYPTLAYGWVLAHDLGNGKFINWVETHQRENYGQSGTVDSRSFFDGLGRKVMTRAEGESAGRIVVSDTQQFNARSLAWKKYLPYFDTGTLDFKEPSFSQSGFTEHVYDALGRETVIYQPIAPGATTREFGRTTYEPLARKVEDEEQTVLGGPYAGNATRFVEDGLPDEKGAGRLREVHEVVRLNDDGTPAASANTWITRYRYDPLGNFLGYTDSQNNQTFQFYDGLKRKVFEDDPDRGWSWFAFDGAGNLVRSRDALGQEIARTYDGVNRTTAEFYCTPAENTGTGLSRGQRWRDSGAPPSRVSDVAFHFDYPRGPIETGEPPLKTPAEVLVDAILEKGSVDPRFDLDGDGQVNVVDLVIALHRATSRLGITAIGKETVVAANTLGQLASVRDLSGGEDTSYDSRGRAEWTAKRIARSSKADSITFLTRWAYDAMDRPNRQTFADGTVVDFAYNSRGLVGSVPNVLIGASHNPAGQIATTQLACGTVTTRNYDYRLRLSRLETVRTSDAVRLQNLVYSYDNVSNIVSITDQRTDDALDQIGVELGITSTEARKFRETQTYSYDALQRLIGAANPSTFGTVGFRYDRIGNMRAKTAALIDPDPKMDLGEMVFGGSALGSGNTGAWNRIGRAPAAPPGPHAFTSSARGGSEGASLTSVLDAAGRATNHLGVSLSWDHLDRIRSATTASSQAEYVYDYTHSRKRKAVTPVSGGMPSETLYVDGTSEMRGGSFQRYVSLGVDRIAVSDTAGVAGAPFAPTGFFLHDHLGSTNLALSASAMVREQSAYQPYGRTRLEKKAAGLSGLSYRYIGKERDEETELSYVERRYLDMATGRFDSLDPLGGIQPIAQRLNRYAYGRANPIRLVDPSGTTEQEQQEAQVGGIFSDAWQGMEDSASLKTEFTRTQGSMSYSANTNGDVSAEIAVGAAKLKVGTDGDKLKYGVRYGPVGYDSKEGASLGAQVGGKMQVGPAAIGIMGSAKITTGSSESSATASVSLQASVPGYAVKSEAKLNVVKASQAIGTGVVRYLDGCVRELIMQYGGVVPP